MTTKGTDNKRIAGFRDDG